MNATLQTFIILRTFESSQYTFLLPQSPVVQSTSSRLFSHDNSTNLEILVDPPASRSHPSGSRCSCSLIVLGPFVQAHQLGRRILLLVCSRFLSQRVSILPFLQTLSRCRSLKYLGFLDYIVINCTNFGCQSTSFQESPWW